MAKNKKTINKDYVKLTVYLTFQFHQRFKRFAITRKMMMTEIMRTALFEYLERESLPEEKRYSLSEEDN